MNTDQERFGVTLSALMHLCSDAWCFFQMAKSFHGRDELYRGTSAENSFGEFSKTLVIMTESSLYTLCIKISSIAFRDPKSINIRDLIDEARNKVIVFRNDAQPQITPFCEEASKRLDQIREKSIKIKDLRDRIIAHTDKQLINQFQSFPAVFEYLLKDVDNIFEFIDELLSCYTDILNSLNSFLPDDTKINFCINKELSYAGEMTNLMNKLLIKAP